MAHSRRCGFVEYLTILLWYSSYYQEVQANLRIVNGDEVVPHSMPYMCALQTEINGRNIICGGSLIKTNQVLTAASCVYGAERVTVILGAHNLKKQEDSQVRVQSSNFTIHHDYNPKSHLNDIAIIRLENNVNLTDAISIIPTPNPEDMSRSYSEDLGVVAGWGKYNDTNPSYSPVLKKFEATIIPFISCTISYFGSIHLSQMCTTGMQDGGNICLGDNGSPLVVNGTQVGIASYGSDFGCSIGFPGVYTRLTSFYPWLVENSNN